MADNYNSSYTGTQVDDAVKKVSERGITTKDSQTTLTENRVVVGDTGGRNIKSSNISVSDVENAINNSATFNSSGVTSANTLTDGYLIQGKGNRTIETTGITTSSVNTSITRAGDYNTNGIKNGPKVDSGGDITAGNLVAYAGNNKIVDTEVETSSVATMTIGVPETGSTGTGYLMLSENPGITKNSSIAITAALKSSGSSSKFGTAVLYYGRNFYDVGHIQHTDNVSSLLGQRDVAYTVDADLQNRLYVAASDSVTSNGFTTLTSASAYSGKVYNFNLKYNHLYLVVSKWDLIARSSQDPFNPTQISFYSGASRIVSAVVTLTDSSGNKIESTTETAAYTGGTVYAYAYLRPTFTYTGATDTKSAFVSIHDATALSGDVLSSMFIVDVTEAGDDAYDITSSSSSGRVQTLDQIFAKYLAGVGSFVAGSSIQRTKYNGPYYTAMDYFRPYYRNWFIRVPSGLRVYIKEYKTSNGSTPSGYIKTISVGPSTNIAVALDQSVQLGEACLEFMIGKADDSALPTIGTGSGQIAPNDTLATADCGALIQYVAAEFVGKAIDPSAPFFSWVRHYPAINMANGAELTTNSISAADYDSGNGAWTNTSFAAASATKIYDLSSVTEGSEDSIAIGTISFQTFGNAKFNMGAVLTDSSKTRIAYHVDSVNHNIIHVEQQVCDINSNPLLSSLPTTAGNYYFKVEDEHTPGSWERDEGLSEVSSPLPYYIFDDSGLVIQDIVNNHLAGKAFCLKYRGNNYLCCFTPNVEAALATNYSFNIQKVGSTYRFASGNAGAELANKHWYDIISSAYVSNLATYEEVENKSSSYFVSYTDTIANIKSDRLGSVGKFYVYNYGNHMLEDKTTQLLNGDYDDITLINNSFCSQNEEIVNAGNYLVVFGGGAITDSAHPDMNRGDRILYQLVYSGRLPFNIGDIFRVVEAVDDQGNVLSDRWYGGGLTPYRFLKINSGESSPIEITYSELKSLRDNSQLIAGRFYRITDYITTVDRHHSYLGSANHQFDIIVRADSSNTLNAIASAAQHAGDTYFSNSNLSAWTLWYCLDNVKYDPGQSYTNKDRIVEWVQAWEPAYFNLLINYSIQSYYRSPEDDATVGTSERPFAWKKSDGTFAISETENPVVRDTVYLVSSGTTYSVYQTYPETEGKGVIYRMIDEYNNDCPYDFKNIVNKHYINRVHYDIYTFSSIEDGECKDASLDYLKCRNNYIAPCMDDTSVFKGQRFNNIFMWGTSVQYFNNTFLPDCRQISFYNYADMNNPGPVSSLRVQNNQFGSDDYNISFRGNLLWSTFGNGVHDCHFGSEYRYIVIHNGVYSCVFRTSSGATYSTVDNVSDLVIDPYVQYLDVVAAGTGTLQHIHIHSSGNNFSRKTITLTRNLSYTTEVYAIGSTEMFI